MSSGPDHIGSDGPALRPPARAHFPQFPKNPDLVLDEKNAGLLQALLPALQKYNCLQHPVHKRRRSPWVRAFVDLYHPGVGPWGCSFSNAPEITSQTRFRFKSYMVPKIYDLLVHKYQGHNPIHLELRAALREYFDGDQYLKEYMAACERIALQEVNKPVADRAPIPTVAADVVGGAGGAPAAPAAPAAPDAAAAAADPVATPAPAASTASDTGTEDLNPTSTNMATNTTTAGVANNVDDAAAPAEAARVSIDAPETNTSPTTTKTPRPSNNSVSIGATNRADPESGLEGDDSVDLPTRDCNRASHSEPGETGSRKRAKMETDGTAATGQRPARRQRREEGDSSKNGDNNFFDAPQDASAAATARDGNQENTSHQEEAVAAASQEAPTQPPDSLEDANTDADHSAVETTTPAPSAVAASPESGERNSNNSNYNHTDADVIAKMTEKRDKLAALLAKRCSSASINSAEDALCQKIQSKIDALEYELICAE